MYLLRDLYKQYEGDLPELWRRTPTPSAPNRPPIDIITEDSHSLSNEYNFYLAAVVFDLGNYMDFYQGGVSRFTAHKFCGDSLRNRQCRAFAGYLLAENRTAEILPAMGDNHYLRLPAIFLYLRLAVLGRAAYLFGIGGSSASHNTSVWSDSGSLLCSRRKNNIFENCLYRTWHRRRCSNFQRAVATRRRTFVARQ